MTRYVNQGLTGANCTVGEQAIISLSVTEDADADYDTASAVVLAHTGAHATGTEIESIEGGTSTGYWVVEDPGHLQSGERTWRGRDGVYSHLPWVTYRLRRKGYLEARATLCRENLGSDNFPLKFWSQDYWWRTREELHGQLLRGEITPAEYEKRFAGMRIVTTGSAIISQLCALMGLTVTFHVQCPVVVDEYIPLNKPLMSALREVAAWSGASVRLDRLGGVVIWSYPAVLAGAGGVPSPTAILERETHDQLVSVSSVTVVGEHVDWAHQWQVPDPVEGEPPGGNWVRGRWVWVSTAKPVEWTERIDAPGGALEERIELREYSITPDLARYAARERLARVLLAAKTLRVRGPADGMQAVRPVTNRIFSVTRSLEWTGSGYRYDCEITSPWGSVPWDTTEAPEDSWT